MKQRIPMVLAVLSLTLVVALGLEGKVSSTRDSEQGLSKSSVFDDPVPEIHLANTSEPGERSPAPRRFPQQPPVVPHGVADFVPITLSENQCVDCHAVEEKVEGEPTPIPESHFVDLRNAPGGSEEEIVGGRYNCVSCHVSPGDNTPLVENVFGRK